MSIKNWSSYRRLLVAQVEDRKAELEHAEKQHQKAKAFYDTAVRGLETFERYLDEKLEELNDELG